MRDQFTAMLDMQDRMNIKVHPEWIKQNFAWHRALWIECGELIVVLYVNKNINFVSK
jgi:hypothetical protein